MYKWVIFFHTQDKKNVFWFCSADTEEDARKQFNSAYSKMAQIMDVQGYFIAIVP